MKYNQFYKRVIEHLGNYKALKMEDVPNGNYRNDVKSYILPREMRNRNLLRSSNGIDDDQYHMYAHHLNSSQMMCINFFSPLLNEDEMLIEVICRQLRIDQTAYMKIKKAKFEHTPHGKKRTNFDFYVELMSGEKFYFEAKYTESGFGGITEDKKYPDRYKKEWENFYKEQVNSSLHLSNMNESDFYSNYQLNRNIAYVTNENDYVCFVFPFDNNNLHSKVDLINFKNVIKINWNDLCKSALDITMNTKYFDHYVSFKEKYLDY